METAWTPKDIEAVQRSVLLGRLPPPIVQTVLNDRAPLAVKKGQVICRQNEKAICCFVILSGTIKQSRVLAPGATAIISIHKVPQSLMEGDALDSNFYSTSAEAVTDARLACVDASFLRNLIAKDPSVALAMLASASAHLRMLLGQVERLKTMTATARLADFILSLIEPGAATATVSLPYEKKLLAAQLGITPESFSRTLRQLHAHGVLVNKSDVQIADVSRLRRLRFNQG